MTRVGLYVHALRAAQPRQLAARALRPVRRRRFPGARRASLGPVGELEGFWRSPAFAHSDGVAGAGFVDVLGLEVPFPPPDWALRGEPRLRRFHLHYGEEVLGWARRSDLGAARGGMQAWIAGNPPRDDDAWHPYATSQRVANWVAALTLEAELADGEVAISLARQARRIAANVEDDVLGNHLIANARALVLAGRALDDRGLLGRGVDLLRREVPQQVLPDGGHYERSPVYHALVLRDLLEARAAAELDWLDEPIERMRRFASALQRPDGLPAPFNDAPLELAPKLDLPPAADGATVFSDTGYVVVRRPGLWLAFDCGAPAPSFLPAHAHADALSLQLWVDDRPVIVDPGTSTYEPGALRDRERSTRAHATATVDGREQFEVWGAFRSGPLPDVRLIGELTAEARYAGVVHRRSLALGGALTVSDEANGRIEARYPLAPGAEFDADSWEEGTAAERLYTTRPVRTAVRSGDGAVEATIPLRATLLR